MALRSIAAGIAFLTLGAAPSQGGEGGGSLPRTAQVSAVVHTAEAALRRGDAAAATELFERAASLEHASDIEVGLVRSLMQAGQYRQALAFAAHAAGAHAEQPGGAALYACLLAAGGQAAFAQRLLDEAGRRLPGDALIADIKRQLAAPATPPHGFAPADTGLAPGSGLPDRARIVSTGVLIDQGRRALAPSVPLGSATTVWARNGLGQTVSARLERRIDSLGLAVLALDRPLDLSQALTLPERDAFPGAPASTVEFSTTPDAAPAWPRLHSGFLGSVDTALGARRLGIGPPPGPRGAPVFDAGGRLVGMSIADPGRPDRLLPLSALRRELGEALASAPMQAIAPRMAIDEVYERSLRVVLQIITAP